MGLAEIKWSFFSRARDTSKKRFLTNFLLFCSVCREQGYGRGGGVGRGLGDGFDLGVGVGRGVASLLPLTWPWRSVLAWALRLLQALGFRH